MDELRRVVGVRRKGDALRAVETEIVQEKSSALGRAGVRLDEALAALRQARTVLDEVERRLRQGGNSVEAASKLRSMHAKLVGDIGVLRQRAHLAHQSLIIQREAVGAWHHTDVERCYRVAEDLA